MCQVSILDNLVLVFAAK